MDQAKDNIYFHSKCLDRTAHDEHRSWDRRWTLSDSISDHLCLFPDVILHLRQSRHYDDDQFVGNTVGAAVDSDIRYDGALSQISHFHSARTGHGRLSAQHLTPHTLSEAESVGGNAGVFGHFVGC